MQSNCLKLLPILLLLKFSISSEVSLEELRKSCSFLGIREDYYLRENYKNLNNIINEKRDSELFNLRFYVITSQDAHILLSEKNTFNFHDKVYEIVFGAGRNTHSEIRFAKGRSDRSQKTSYKHETPIVNPLTPLPIRVIQNKDGKLTVFVSNKEYFTYIDAHPLKLKYLNFKSWSNKYAQWFYNCTNKNEGKL